MGGDGPSASADIMGPTDEGPFALKWDDQRVNILRAFLFMRGDDGVEHGAEELAKKTHAELVVLCVQAQQDRKRAIDKPWLSSVPTVWEVSEGDSVDIPELWATAD